MGAGFGIRDMRMRAFCSLDGKNVLQWDTRRAAMRWLSRCYQAWGVSPELSEEPPPQGQWKWLRSFREESVRSPWEQWTVPIPPEQRAF